MTTKPTLRELLHAKIEQSRQREARMVDRFKLWLVDAASDAITQATTIRVREKISLGHIPKCLMTPSFEQLTAWTEEVCREQSLTIILQCDRQNVVCDCYNLCDVCMIRCHLVAC
jgi:hypothetical protein